MSVYINKASNNLSFGNSLCYEKKYLVVDNCEVGRTTVINIAVLNNRNYCEIYQRGVSGDDTVVRK